MINVIIMGLYVLYSILQLQTDLRLFVAYFPALSALVLKKSYSSYLKYTHYIAIDNSTFSCSQLGK